jgi:DNA helicase HerA-like ATPase
MSNAKQNGSNLPSRLAEVDSSTMPGKVSIQEKLAAEIAAAGGEEPSDPELAGSIGTTMFDLPGSEDNTVTVVLPKETAQQAASQTLVEIRSRKDGRSYIGMVTAGPFAEPDSLRGDSHMLVTVATRGGNYQPPYHGRVQVTILGEKLPNGSLAPPRLRPLPNSPVFALNDKESAQIFKAAGDIRLGTVVGYEEVAVAVPSDKKLVLPRHTAVLGTTGGGKSTTIARFIQQAQAASMAVILLDVEGEYTHLNEPTTNKDMLAALKERKLEPMGIPSDRMTIYHLVGRETSNPGHPHVQPFSLQFASLSPYAAAEIIGLTEPQETRFLRAYDIAKEVMRELGIFPAFKNEEQERIAIEIDEFERGYPRLTLEFMMDVVGACLVIADSKKEGRDRGKGEGVTFATRTPILATSAGHEALRKKIFSGPRPDSAVSWRGVLGRLARLARLKVFDIKSETCRPLNYATLLKPGTVSVIDLSDATVSELTNIVIADLLRGVQGAQDKTYQEYDKGKREGKDTAAPTRALVIIEEAHEFLSAERIDKTKILFQQVARIAKRGRKRWLGLVFVTQLPQHLPRQVFGLVNSYILHKITDAEVVSTLRRTVSGIDAGLWDRLTGLAPGQAIVSFPHMTRPLLVSVDPTPAELRLVD